MSFITSNIKSVQHIVELCYLKGVEDIIISPGSRNAPLTIAFNQRKKFNCFSIVDERAAAFFALGIAQQKQKPVVVVCTSGSAAVNYYPAIVEAFYQQIPLIVITADRPLERIDQGAGQTIRQENVFVNHILFSANLLEGENNLNFNDRLVNTAINKANSKDLKGPVHINVPLKEPLYDTLEINDVVVKDIRVFDTESKLSESALNKVIDKIENTEKVLLLSGTNYPDEILNKSLDTLTRRKNLVLLTETTSNINTSYNIECIDKVINTIDDITKEALKPNLVITFGGAIVSKMIKSWILDNNIEHWHISKNAEHKDTFNTLTTVIDSAPSDFFFQLSQQHFNLKKIDSDFSLTWKNVYEIKDEKHHLFFNQQKNDLKFTDLSVFKTIFDVIPSNVQLQLSNSSVVRYAQLFEHEKQNHQFANRGTSGIDGSTGTAIGAAVAIAPKPVVLITGDISFFYDSNSLWNKHIPTNFKIILINNSGGGIFKIIPGPASSEELEEFFVTKHNLSAIDIAKTFGFNYKSFKSENLNDLNTCLNSFFIEKEKTILEIFTPSEMNDRHLKEYFNFLKN